MSDGFFYICGGMTSKGTIPKERGKVMSNLPTPDPAEGRAASEEAAQARRDAEEALRSGTMRLEALFTQVDAESEEQGHKVYGHMHLRAALLALPFIGEKKANEILDNLGLAHDVHLAQLGDNQRQAVIQAVIDHSPATESNG